MNIIVAVCFVVYIYGAAQGVRPARYDNIFKW